MPTFAAGVLKFQNTVFPEKETLFESLSHGQSPEALFITCADSRIETAMITQTGPGELFICRNAGNIVPPHTNDTDGMTASIEYAVAVLKVPHIVVCGHSGCGAMAGAMDMAGLESIPNVQQWLMYSKAAVAVVEQIGQGKNEAAIAMGKVELHGWVYDIKSGGVTAYDEIQDKFVLVDEKYAAAVAELAAKNSKSCFS